MIVMKSFGKLLSTAGLLCALANPWAINKVTAEEFKPKYDTITHKLIESEKELPLFDEDTSVYGTLDAFIDIAKERIPVKKEYSRDDVLEILSTIDGILQELKIPYQFTIYLHDGLEQRIGDCDIFSYLYLAVGDALDLPIYAVLIPEHMFVRWELDNGSHINWETTQGKELPDFYYEDGFYVSRRAVDHGLFMRDLNDEELQALHHEVINELDKAIIEYSKRIRDNPKDINAYFRRGITERANRSDKQSINDFTKVIELDPELSEGYYERGLTYSMAEIYHSAIKDFSKALEFFPNNPVILQDRAVAYHLLGKTKKYEYLQQLETLVNSIDRYARASEILGEIEYLFDLDIEEIEEITENIISSYLMGMGGKTRLDGLLYQLFTGEQPEIETTASIMQKLNEWIKDDLMYRDLIQRFELESEDIYNILEIIACKNMPEFKNAIDDYSASLIQIPDDYNIIILRGMVWEERYEFERAIEDYTKAIAMNPEFTHTYFMLSKVWEKIGDFEKAAEGLTELIAIDPTNVEAYEQRAWIYVKMHQVDLADMDFKKAEKLQNLFLEP